MTGNQDRSPQAQLEDLLRQCRTLQLATLGEHGAEASYAPYVYQDNCFYIYISELAGHTRNLINHPEPEIMLIADESATRNLFARTRLTVQCQAGQVCRDQAEWSAVMDEMQQRFGETVAMLRSLSDFHLFRLTPVCGRLVLGFGQAYRVMLPGFELELIEGR